MSRRFAERLALAAFAAASLSATAAVPEPLPPPPLKPGEMAFVTANGCALVYSMGSATAQQITANRVAIAANTWEGACRNGLAHGKGRIHYPAREAYQAGSYQAEFFLGRPVRISDDGNGKIWFTGEDKRVVAASKDSSIDAPVWRTDTEEAAGLRGTEVLADNRVVATYTSCGWQTCEYKIWSYGLGENAPPSTYTPCPNPSTYVGCDVLWRQMAGPLIATYRSVRAEVEGRLPAWQADLTQLNAARDARFTALDNANAEAFRRSQAAAEADAGKGDRDFKTKLATANAGQLYAMADQFERAGDTGKAADAFRALLSRFPDHALTVTAAQHLSALPAPGPGAATCDPAAEETQVGMALNAAMDRIAPSNARWQYEAILAATERSAAAWSRCPAHPSTAGKLRAYQAAYVETARRCAMISPTGACKPDMH